MAWGCFSEWGVKWILVISSKVNSGPVASSSIGYHFPKVVPGSIVITMKTMWLKVSHLRLQHKLTGYCRNSGIEVQQAIQQGSQELVHQLPQISIQARCKKVVHSQQPPFSVLQHLQHRLTLASALSYRTKFVKMPYGCSFFLFLSSWKLCIKVTH